MLLPFITNTQLTTLTEEQCRSGFLMLIDKPLEWTSFDVVNKVRWLLRKKFNIKKLKVGHAGTLDPLATGLLVMCIGKYTKHLNSLQGQAKTYTGTIRLGATTPSYDLETEVDQTFPTDHITKSIVENATSYFTGDIQQYPPVFSAIKKDGKRLYEYARQGLEVSVEPRQVHVDSFRIINFQLPDVDFEIACSKGTYIRSLAYDFGQKLDSGGHLVALRRTKIGSYDVSTALSPSEFEDVLKSKAT